ncbi:MAG: hypothetical protein COX06_03055 [Candidatus Zambryskibacteria bacterium CG22_combo_CG10-13_8_21_14_all_42_17]|uniref:Uncharacterized protein n=1 Tax=Candidatus Zambryskibacteria bacterium CG22_combo_CG10-13_8_21_14_all_42_17 TaxID=1975118 RepID=A0A2H0BCT3_9BACT|nr:MAG: hypothetical protein COX06_03055 [Candidatus Zambryskibacteria bacterium CG22_combo_CG10-13_8_21_14_all_42_17]
MGDTNKRGHIILTFNGLDLSGKAEIERLEKADYRISDSAKSLFLSERNDSYDRYGRLVAGHIYKVALVPCLEIKNNKNWATSNMRRLAIEPYWYGKPLAGMVPRLCEALSDEEMHRFGILYAAVLHDPIMDDNNCLRVLYIERSNTDRWIRSRGVMPVNNWGPDAVFAFPVVSN